MNKTLIICLCLLFLAYPVFQACVLIFNLRITESREIQINPVENSITFSAKGYYPYPISPEGSFPPWRSFLTVKFNSTYRVDQLKTGSYEQGKDFECNQAKKGLMKFNVENNEIVLSGIMKNSNKYMKHVLGTYSINQQNESH